MVVNIKLNTDNSEINAIDLVVLFPAMLEVKNISKSNSFVQLWLREPSYTRDAIFISGGIPGGISSNNTIVATVTFRAVAVGDGSIGLGPSSTILLNDGKGSNDPLYIDTPSIHISPRTSKVSGDPTPSPISKKSKEDRTRPNHFDIVIGQDTNIFEGQHFSSFFTTDSGAGLNYYEIKEGHGVYKIARSPYLLEDQSLKTVLHVRAYDNAGNFRESVYPNIFKRIWWAITRFF